VTRLFVLARHGESTLNVERVVNGDPSRDVRLTAKWRDEARLLGRQTRNVEFATQPGILLLTILAVEYGA
jgi:broad specificity phosphatase PhoE